jgi:tRNA/tmRNA/rRNA uracil-C5-methylase (TrmA/RlmC/RlmD family)
VGERHEVTVGPVAHGGHCVARLQEGRVVFVRHALPGERVVIAVTEGTDGDRFWRADAVEVLDQSADRATAPCPFAGPDRCGGCDFQHVTLDRQRLLKAHVVQEQLARLAAIDTTVEVEPVEGDEHGLRWRTRQHYVVLPGGGLGMRKHRSHDVVAIDDCLIARRDARTPMDDQAGAASVVHVVETSKGSCSFTVAADGFWQVHPGAPRALVETVLDLLAPRPGESVLDLYAGVGLFTGFLAHAVGSGGSVTAVERDAAAAAHARSNVPTAVVEAGDVLEVLEARPVEHCDLVVLDPPRTGARRAVVEQVVARSPRAVAYVACDPAALARDVAIFAEHGYALGRMRAFDIFPMTHHVECVALLEAPGSA